ncbi:MAG: ComEC/Rec2 family competence protein, partial [Clostridiaceae bacterium]|nr:ComEC/Rec2 family competence protein [Clostridiaceae bacterium]
MAEWLRRWEVSQITVLQPGAVCFVLLVAFSFLTGYLKIARWEGRVPAGVIGFSGLVVEAGNALPGDPQGVRAQKIRLSDGTPVVIYTDLPARKGDQIEGRALFECAEGTRNPGGFSERNWLWSKGAVWIGRTGTYRLVPRQGVLLWLRRLPNRIRDYVRQHHFPLWEKGCGPLLLSLVAGDTRLLDDRQTFFLRSSGLSHLTSISGTHLIFLLSPVLWMTRKTRLSYRARQWITLPLILLPGVLSGWKCGISRASLTIFASRLDLVTRRRREIFNLLFFAGSVMLAIDPYALFDSSFWMSLSAAGAVSCTAKRLAKRPDPAAGSKGLNALMFSAAAQLVILPYQIMTAPGIHLLAPFLNMAALPLAAWLMAVTYPAIFILSLLPRSSAAFNLTVRLFTALLTPAADLLLGMSHLVAKTHDAFISLGCCLLLVPLIACFAWYLPKRKKSLLSLTIFVAAALVWLAAVRFAAFSSRGAKVVFLDVGQGDATLFITESRQTLLIDGGGKKCGYNTVIPAARMQALNHIDLAIVTHAHSDHAAGVAELIDAGFVGHLCLPAVEGDSHADSLHEEDLTSFLLELSDKSQVPVTRLRAGDAIRLDDCLIEVLHPDTRRGLV